METFMKAKLPALLLYGAIALATLGPGAASAADVTVVGPVTRIELSADGKSALATLKDGASGEDIVIVVTDDLTLDKFKDKRIVEGDEIRARFEKKDAGNASKTFKKTAGC
jgi:hypothetical protein